jgi:hypothetical protein
MLNADLLHVFTVFSITSTSLEVFFTFMTISRWIIPRIGSVLDKSCRENQNTHFMFSNFFPRKSRRSWDNVEKRGWAEGATNDVIIWCVRVECCISKATLTQRQICNTCCFSRATWLRYTHVACLVILRCRQTATSVLSSFCGNVSTCCLLIKPWWTTKFCGT